MPSPRRSDATTPWLFGDPSEDLKEVPERPADPSRDGTEGASLFARVAIARPLRCEFTYAVPEECASTLAAGMRVAVPFGRRREVGVVVGVQKERGDVGPRLRWIAKQLDEEPIVGPELLALTRWMADEYACSWGEALGAVLPAALKRERGRRIVLQIEPVAGVGEPELAELEERFPKQHRLLRTLLELDGPIELRELTRRLNLSDAPAKTLAKKGYARIERVAVSTDPLVGPVTERPRHAQLTTDQETAVAAICERLDAGEPASFLLQGVTGSGKTEVYLRAIERALEAGRDAIVLVPEIALTPQTVSWFRSRFGEIAVLHSRMSDAQRLDTWKRVQSGELRVVVGARSALFAPVRNLGVVVVDEEHEPSFKQGSTPRYHAREVALRRAAQASAVCVLGSATPSLESRRRTHEGELRRLLLAERVSGARLPEVDVVDMRSAAPGPGRGVFSKVLADELREVLRKGEQAILFQNRRGFAPVLWCPGCESTVKCERCDVGLTFHKRIRRLVCHSCCEERAFPEQCPTCTRPGLRQLGAGSERVEQVLAKEFPEARVARMDSDTMVRREDYEATLDAFGRCELDVLVGTQMIAKGLDFPRVTLVGIVFADGALHLPDFRASERTFQLIAQVAGRAGRGELPGRIVVQTMNPEHPAIRYAAKHDYESFARTEDALRAELGYPPHGRLVRAVFEDADEPRAAAEADRCAEALRASLGDTGAVVLGAAPAPLAQLRGRFRHHLLVKVSRSGPALALARRTLIELTAEVTRPRILIDVDPTALL